MDASEKLLSLAQATHEVHGRPTVRTIWRWYLTGVDGVRLETVKIGGRRYTSKEALERFQERLTNPTKSRPTDSARRAREIADAEAELQEAGF